MPVFDRGNSHDRLARQLNTHLVRYEASVRDLEILLNSLSNKDLLSEDGLMNVRRAVTADALDEQNRQEEAALMRSNLPIYFTREGKVRQRIANPVIEKRFVRGYLASVLSTSLDPATGRQLSDTLGPELN